MIVLDTNVISELVRPSPNPVVRQWLDRQSPEQLYLATPVLAELLLGLYLLPIGKRQRELQIAVISVADTYFADRILTFDAIAAIRYSAIMARGRQAGRPIAIMDAQIAAIALAAGASVATRDIVPFTAALVPTINPWQT